MLHGVFVIDGQSSDPIGTLTSALENAHLKVRSRSPWSSFNRSQLTACHENLIVVNATPKTVEAIDLFDWLHHNPVHVPTLAILPPHDPQFIRIAAAAVDDFVFWPVHEEELRNRVLRLIGAPPQNTEEVHRTLLDDIGLGKIVGTAPAFQQVLSRIALFGTSESAVLLTGETGTGKELCARVIHLLSRRRNGPFVPVDCGSLPDHLFENEVFGHVRGAFTDAHSEQNGLVALARNGTLFLDEVDSLSILTQGKLLRLLQEQTFRPLGSEKFCHANVRIVAATNNDLSSLVTEKRFRSDLFFRLDVLRVHLPPLRERPTDIAVLARHFITEICAKDGLHRKLLVPATIRKLELHPWPGNVRELCNVIERAVLTTPGAEILPMHIDLPQSNVRPLSDDHHDVDFRSGKNRAIERFERSYIEHLLGKHAGNITRAATEAGKDRRAFGRLVKKYGVRSRPAN